MQSDPIGVGGGINFYSYVSNNSLRLIDSNGLCWGNDDAIRYFYTGGGNSISLSSTGCKGIVTANIRKDLEEMKREARKLARFYASSMGCDKCESGVNFKLTEIGAYSGVFWIGGIALRGKSTCTICTSCNSNNCSGGQDTYEFFCGVKSSMHDQFINPSDFDNSNNDFWDQWQYGGTPFYVDSDWTDIIRERGRL